MNRLRLIIIIITFDGDYSPQYPARIAPSKEYPQVAHEETKMAFKQPRAPEAPYWRDMTADSETDRATIPSASSVKHAKKQLAVSHPRPLRAPTLPLFAQCLTPSPLAARLTSASTSYAHSYSTGRCMATHPSSRQRTAPISSSTICSASIPMFQRRCGNGTSGATASTSAAGPSKTATRRSPKAIRSSLWGARPAV